MFEWSNVTLLHWGQGNWNWDSNPRQEGFRVMLEWFNVTLLHGRQGKWNWDSNPGQEGCRARCLSGLMWPCFMGDKEIANDSEMSDSLIFGERNERFANIAHLIWAKWAINSHRSPKKRKWAKMSDSIHFLDFFFFKPEIKHSTTRFWIF